MQTCCNKTVKIQKEDLVNIKTESTNQVLKFLDKINSGYHIKNHEDQKTVKKI